MSNKQIAIAFWVLLGSMTALLMTIAAVTDNHRAAECGALAGTIIQRNGVTKCVRMEALKSYGGDE